MFIISPPLPIKQPIKVDKHNIYTLKSGVQDLVVTHYDCSPKHITNMQYYKLNVRSNQQTFKSSPLKYKYFHKFGYFKYAPTPYMLNVATKKAFVTKSHLKEASSLITIIGMLTIWKGVSLPQKLKLVENLHALVS